MYHLRFSEGQSFDPVAFPLTTTTFAKSAFSVGNLFTSSRTSPGIPNKPRPQYPSLDLNSLGNLNKYKPARLPLATLSYLSKSSILRNIQQEHKVKAVKPLGVYGALRLPFMLV